MTILIKIQLAIAAVGAVFTAVFFGATASTSFTGGAALTLFNLAILVFGWPRLLAQKQVARAVAAIIFKFAILGWILYLVSRSPSINIGWFALGLGTVIPSVVLTALTFDSSSKEAV